MANIITAPESGIYFDGNTAGTGVIPVLTGNASGVAIQYDGYAGITISSSATGANYQDRFSIEGENGRLFGVSDQVTGSVFSVNDGAGLPLIDVDVESSFSKITLGQYGTDAIVISGSSVQVTGSNVVTEGHLSDENYVTSDEILTHLLTVDGANSNLDADKLDGQQGSYYLDYGNFSNTPTVNDVSETNLLNRLAALDSSDTIYIGDAGDDTTVVVRGTLQVDGSTTTINSNTLSIGDNQIVLNNDVTGTPTQNAGIIVERGTATNASLIWDESNDYWKAGLAGSEVQLALTNGTYSGLRAQSTTKGDVGLGNVTNESKATMFSSPSFTGDVDVAGSITTEGPDGGMVMRTWTGGGSYGMIGTANMSGGEYSLLTDGTSTYLSGGTGGNVYIRGGDNDSDPQITVSNGNIGLAGVPSKSSEATAIVWDGTNIGYRELGSAAFSATSAFATVAQGTSAETAYGWGDHSGAGYLTSSSTQSKYLRSDADDTVTGEITGSGDPSLSGFFLPQNPEGRHVKAPWFFNDMAYARLKGATISVTVTGGSSPSNTNIDAMFDASTGFWNLATSGVTEVVIEITNPPKTMYHGSHMGATFGNTTWRPKDIKLESYYNGQYNELLDVSNQSKEYVTTSYNSGGNAQSKLRWTFSNFNSTSMRIVSLFAYNYDATGMPSLYLANNGGELYGDVTLKSPTGSSQSSYALKLRKTNSSSAAQDGAEIVSGPYSTNTNGGDLILKTSNTSAVLTERMRINGAGNVGIGTTSPFSKLTVSKAGINEGTISFDDQANNAHLTLAGSDSLVRLQMGTYNNGSYGVWIQGSYDNGGTNYGTEPIILNPQGGRVGIGTTGPAYSLHVETGGDTTVLSRTTSNAASAAFTTWNNNGSSGNNMQLKSYGQGVSGTTFGVNVSKTNMLWSSGDTLMAVGTIGATPLIFGTSNAERMRIGSNGYVGMGASNNSNQRLVLHQADSNGSHLRMQNTRTGGGFFVMGVGDSGSSSSITPAGGLFFYNGTTRMVIDSSGNVGIGTTSPSHKLEVGLTSTVALANQPAEPLHVSNDGQSCDGRVFISVKHDVVNTASAVGAGFKMTAAAVTSGTASYDDSLIFLESAGPGNDTIHSAPKAIKFYVDNHDTNAGSGANYGDLGDLALTIAEDTNATFAGNVTATNILTIAGAATGSPYLQFTQGGSQKAYIQYVDSGDSFELQTDNQLVLRTGGSTTALTINSSQNATFAGDLTVSGEVEFSALNSASASPFVVSDGGTLGTRTAAEVLDDIGGRVTKKISGDGSATTFTVTHSFGTPHVMTQLLDYGDNGTGATYEFVQTTVKRNSDNAIDVLFGVAPTSSEDYLVLITKMPAIS